MRHQGFSPSAERSQSCFPHTEFTTAGCSTRKSTAFRSRRLLVKPQSSPSTPLGILPSCRPPSCFLHLQIVHSQQQILRNCFKLWRSKISAESHAPQTKHHPRACIPGLISSADKLDERQHVVRGSFRDINLAELYHELYHVTV